jgi:1-deoxyxylulose-5-phosphate synthase
MHAWQFAQAQYVADAHGMTRFVSMQNHYNLIYREEEREMIPQCIDQGVGGLRCGGPGGGSRRAGRPAGPGRPVLAAAEEFLLGEEEMKRLEEPYVPHPVLGHQ